MTDDTVAPQTHGSYNGHLSIGASDPQWIGHPDAVVSEIRDNGIYLYSFLDNPTADEILPRVLNMPTEVRFTDQDRVGFFTIQWANGPWAVAPFSPSVLNDPPDIRPAVENGQFWLFDLVVDTSTGTIVNMRKLDLGEPMTSRFLAWYEDQPSRDVDSYQRYSDAVGSVYSVFTNDQLADTADPRDRTIVS